jgi:hypothetical protein
MLRQGRCLWSSLGADGRLGVGKGGLSVRGNVTRGRVGETGSGVIKVPVERMSRAGGRVVESGRGIVVLVYLVED